MFWAVIISIGFIASIALGAAIVIALRKMNARAQARLIARQQPTPPAGAPPPPAAQPAATPPVAAAAINWSFLWKVLKIAMAFVAGFVLTLVAYWLYQKGWGHPSDLHPLSWAQENVQAEWQEVPYWVLAVVILIAAGALWYGNKKKLASLVFTSVVIVFAIVVFYSYRDGWLYHGRWREIFYVLAIALALIAATFATTNKEKLGAGVVLGAIFIMLGVSQLMTYQVALTYLPGGGSSTVVLNGGICTEKVQRAVLNSDGQVLNENGGCFARVHEEVTGHCVDVYDRWGRLLGNDCTANANFDGKYGAKFTASASGYSRTVPVTYVLCNHRGNTNLVADGCP